jgi:2-C-methyl-D-erythritol 4-phosphate cytidylyltransferase
MGKRGGNGVDKAVKVIVAAAGLGRRMNSKINKPYMLIKGRPVLAYSLDILDAFPAVTEIVVVANFAEIEYCQEEIIRKYAYKKVTAIIPGGRERQDSVWNGLMALGNQEGWVAIHDGARPFLTPALLQELLQAARRWGAAIPGLWARDTLKVVDSEAWVMNTLDRSKIMAVQKPQVFDLPLLINAYRMAYADGIYGTDDSSIFERYAGRVKVVAGDPRNLKITTPEDLRVAEALL